MLREGNCISGTLWGHEVEGLAYRVPERGPWDDQPLLPSPDIGQREQPGLRRYLRRQKNGQAYEHRDPEKLCHFPIPEQFQLMMRNVFGDRCKTLKLAMHPHLKRICLFEQHFEPENGRAEEWRLIWICQEQPQEGVLPSDYDGDLERAHLTGQVGEFKWPEYEELITIERTDKKKYGADDVEFFWYKLEHDAEQEVEAKEHARTEAFLDYYFNMVMDEVNQAYGSGQRMTSYATVKLRSNPKKWRRTYKEGYVILEKVSAEEAARVERSIEEAAKELQLKREAHDNFRRYRSPEERKQIEKERKLLAYEIAKATEQVKEGRNFRPMNKRELAAHFRAGLKGKL